MGEFLRGKASVAPAARESWSAGRATSGKAEAVRAFHDVVLAPDLKEQVRRRVEVWMCFWSFGVKSRTT